MGKAAPVIAFFFGAATGGFVVWRILDKKYRERTEKEIESVKEAFGRSPTPPSDSLENTVVDHAIKNAKNHDIIEAAKILTEKRYIPDIPEVPKHDKPYVISPDEFGEFYEYEKVYLTFYADGAIADNEGDILTNDEIEQSIGFESLDHFGEYDDDSVNVRNDAKRCDYEITKDLRNYSDLTPADL